MSAQRYDFGHNDRITIDGVHYRPAGRQGRANLLRLVIDNAVVDTSIRPLTDDEYVSLHAERKIRVEEGYYSYAYQLLRDRAAGTDLSDLSDLNDEQLRTIAWKVEWCVRFNQARIGAAGRQGRPAECRYGKAPVCSWRSACPICRTGSVLLPGDSGQMSDTPARLLRLLSLLIGRDIWPYRSRLRLHAPASQVTGASTAPAHPSTTTPACSKWPRTLSTWWPWWSPCSTSTSTSSHRQNSRSTYASWPIALPRRPPGTERRAPTDPGRPSLKINSARLSSNTPEPQFPRGARARSG